MKLCLCCGQLRFVVVFEEKEFCSFCGSTELNSTLGGCSC